MRHLDAGDITRRLARIRRAKRSNRWRRAARRHLLDEVGARPIGPSRNPARYRLDDGRVVCMKRRYPTEELAAQALEETEANPNPRRRESRLYWCYGCEGYHLTSQDYEDDHDGYEEDHRCRPESEGGQDARPEGGY